MIAIDAAMSVVNTAADLTVLKTGPPKVTPGVVGGVSWTITVSNAGPSDALDVAVNDTLPAGITVVSITPSQGSCTAFPCTLGRIADGASATVTVVGTLDADADPTTSPLANTAAATSSTHDPSEGGEESTAYSRSGSTCES